MPRRRVAIFVDLPFAYGRDLLKGIARYATLHGPWEMYGDTDRIVMPVEDLSRWRGDGVIVQQVRPELEGLVSGNRWPVINVGDADLAARFPTVIPDNAAIGRLAARDLYERGFRDFGFCGFYGQDYSRVRGEGFAAEVQARGCTSSMIEGEGWQWAPQSWPARQAEIAAWIRALPRPVGVFCCSDVRARHVAQICAEIGVRIPEELALIGVDNDELMCDISNVGLSSVDLAATDVGYRAAALLDRLVDGETPPATPLLVPPVGVVTRRSSDVLAVADPSVAEALRYIRENAHKPIGIEHVVGAVAVGRRALERRFRLILGLTIGQQIAGTRMGIAKQLLIHSDLPAPLIAQRCGFSYVQQFNATFRRATSMTPTAYRRQFRVPHR